MEPEQAAPGYGLDGYFTDAQYPSDPYPGARPPFSFVHLDGGGHPLTPVGPGWRLGRVDLDGWLDMYGAPPLAGRVPVLAYGSNACPSKITWLREQLGLAGPVIVLRVRCAAIAAVWAAGLRVVDDQRAATLTAAPDAVEEHAIWLATLDQVRILDVCEGRGRRYRLVRLRTGHIALESGAVVREPLAYVGLAATRRPLLVDGAAVRCADVGQTRARGLVGVAAPSDGLDVGPPGLG